MMAGEGSKDQSLRIDRVIESLKDRPIPIVDEHAPVDEIVEAFVRSPHSRLVYVVDANRKMIGAVSMRSLVRHVFSQSHEPQVHARSLIALIANETARDLMHRRPVHATPDDEVEVVLKKLIRSRLNECPVLDREKRVIGDLTMVDLLESLIR